MARAVAFGSGSASDLASSTAAATMHRVQLLLCLVLLSGAAFVWPRVFGTGADPFLSTREYELLSPMFVVAMFAIGSLLPRDEVRAVIERWPSVLGGTALQYASMPLFAYVVGHAFRLPPHLLVGVIVVGCVPGAMASNVVTLAARGNTSYSVSLTTSATLLSPLIVPFVLWLTLGTRGEIDPIAVSIKLVWTVVLPVVAGHVLSRLSESFASIASRVAPAVANLVILWIIAVVVALNRDRIGETTAVLVLALLLLNGLGYAAGYTGGWAMRLPEPMRRALTLEIGMQNAGLGTLLVLDLFRDQPDAAIPTAVYTFGCMLTGTCLAAFWARSPVPDAVAVAEPEAASSAD